MPYYKNSRSNKSGQKNRNNNNDRHNFSRRPNNNGRPSGNKRFGNGGKKHQGAYIHPSKFINRATTTTETAPYEPQNNFSDFPFTAKLAANIAAQKYQTPSAIQDQSIPHILAGKDLIGLANTGTGKTAAFLLPLINKLDTTKKPLSALILAPTRELAGQIEDQFRMFSNDMNLYATLLVGGSNIDRQIAKLKRNPHVIIATPGRMMDLVKRKQLSLQNIDTLVLDEADRMLDMGFISDIRAVVKLTPASRQTLFFSATMTTKVKQITEEFLTNPEIISVKTTDTSDRVDQNIVEINQGEDKLAKLLNILSDQEFEKVLLFGRTKHGVQRLSDNLRKQDISSVAIHGNKSQSQRQKALSIFKDGKARVMVATDVAARGLDIPNVTHVINFDQPATYEDYIRRIGRTGRGSATGIALTFVEKRQ